MGGRSEQVLRIGLLLVVCAGRHGVAASPDSQLVSSDESYAERVEAPRYKPLEFAVLGSRLVIGGELRERFESVQSPRYGFGGAADTYLLQRVLLGADVQRGERLRVIAQLGWHDTFGKTAAATPVEGGRPDLQQAFVDLSAGTRHRLTLRLGRQEVVLNEAERFISVREGGPNIRQSFDGLRVMWRHHGWNLDALGLSPVALRPAAFDDRSDDSQKLWGIHAARGLGAHSTAAVYFLGFDRRYVAGGQGTGKEQRRSIGLRASHGRAGWMTDVELVHQFGASSGRDISAWALGLDAGYSLRAAGKPRLAVQFVGGTGGNGSDGGKITGFHPMFPKGLYTSWTNTMAIRPSITITPWAAVTLQAGAQFRWRQTVQDAVYFHPQIPLDATRGNTARPVSAVASLDAFWQANPHLRFHLLLARVRAEAAIRAAGGRDIRYIVFTSQLKF